MARIRVTDLSIPELAIYTGLNEAQLLHYREPAPGIFIAESPKVIERALTAGYRPISFLTKEEITAEEDRILESYEDLPIYQAKEELLRRLAGFELTRGMWCAMERKALPSVHELCEGLRRIVVLENVVNPTNIGAIIRSAAALNMEAVLLTPGCADPLYRRAARVSMGTIFQIPWTYIDPWGEEGAQLLRDLGFKSVAMALEEKSVSIDNEQLLQEEKLAVVLGTEGDGLAKTTIGNCDYTVMIPMAHGVDSLNVAAASAVAFWELGR